MKGIGVDGGPRREEHALEIKLRVEGGQGWRGPQPVVKVITVHLRRLQLGQAVLHPSLAQSRRHATKDVVQVVDGQAN